MEHYLPFARDAKLTHNDDKNRLVKHVLPQLGRYSLQDITSQQVQMLLLRCKQSGLAPATVNRIRSLLIRMMNLAVQWQFIDTSPIKGIPKLQENNMRQRFLNKLEIPRFIDALATLENKQAGR